MSSAAFWYLGPMSVTSLPYCEQSIFLDVVIYGFSLAYQSILWPNSGLDSLAEKRPLNWGARKRACFLAWTLCPKSGLEI